MPTKRNSERRREARAATDATLGLPEPLVTEFIGDETGVETTGRFIVLFKEGVASDESMVRSIFSHVAGLHDVASSSDFESGAVAANDLAERDVVHFRRLGLAVVSSEEAVQSLATTASEVDSPILSIEPEYVARLSSAPPARLDLQYLRGYRDAVVHVYDQLTSRTEPSAVEAETRTIFQDSPQFTWGLQATGVSTSRLNGQGIRVAVLDTGLDFEHPDFSGRAIESQTFSGFPIQDIHGHGTHCIGTACGPLRPATGVRRYGIAHAAQIFVGKVFDNEFNPGAATANVVAGIEWAIANGCRIVSLSLGVRINQQLDQYTVPIRRALDAGTLVVCAAGNNANRSGLPGFDPNRPQTNGFVEPPANADQSLAVAAIDSETRLARFSTSSSQLTGVGGKVNIAGPGVAVFSSVPVARGSHALFNGTSMATPHVSGIAALWAQSEGLSGMALWNRLVQSALPLNLPSVDVGAGLIQAPQ
jgi:subtilisin